jgi:hypothetical protein
MQSRRDAEESARMERQGNARKRSSFNGRARRSRCDDLCLVVGRLLLQKRAQGISILANDSPRLPRYYGTRQQCMPLEASSALVLHRAI